MSDHHIESQRHEIEREFHDRWAQSIDISTLLVRESFEAATALENSFALSEMQPLSGKKLLDLGCGAGETSVYFALQGAHVTALDISSEMLSVANRLADHYGVELQTQQAVAERLPFDDGQFDYVFGNGILHHVELEPALAEIHRVLKAGGKAVFVEPLGYNPIIEVYRHLAHTVRTPTEKPFTFNQLKPMEKLFKQTAHREFWLTTLSVFLYFFLVEWQNPSKVRYWKKVIEDSQRLEWWFKPLAGLDDFLLPRVPGLKFMCWNTVITLIK